jgi:hypothetical protein
MLSSGSGISSVAHQLSCFGVGFLLCLFTGGLLLCLTPFLWGKVSDLSTAPLPSACCDGSLFFNFAMLFDFGCCSLAQEMSFVDCYLLYFRQRLTTSPLLALLPFQPLSTVWRSAPCLSPLLRCAFSNSVPLLCVNFQFLVYCSVFFVCGVVSLPRGLCWFISGVGGGILYNTWCSPVGLLNVSQAGLEQVSGGGGSPPVFSV